MILIGIHAGAGKSEAIKMFIFTISSSGGDQDAGSPRLTSSPLKFSLTSAESMYTYRLRTSLYENTQHFTTYTKKSRAGIYIYT